MNYTTYLFDFDYTLADSSRGIVTCFQNVLKRHGYTEVTDEEIKRTIGKTLEDSFSILTGVTDAQQLAGFKKEYGKEADTHMTVNTMLFLETKSVLIALKDAGARIGIISTKFRFRIKDLLNQHFPDNFMDIIIGGEDVKAAKPSPEGLLLAIKQLHATKAETLYIGDSTVDAETAQAAGVDFAGVTHGVTTAQELSKYPHRKIMATLEELLDKNEELPSKSEESPCEDETLPDKCNEPQQPDCDSDTHSLPENTPPAPKKKKRISTGQIILLAIFLWLSYEERKYSDSWLFPILFIFTLWGISQKRRLLPERVIAFIKPRWHPYAVRLRAFHLKLVRGKQAPRNSEEPCTCRNCGTTYVGNFCSRCGQSRKTPRYRFSNALRNILGGFTNIDNGFGRTLIDLLYRPGYMIRDFIDGKRIQYFRPFQTLFILAALYIMAVQIIDPEALKKRDKPKSEQEIESIITARDELIKKRDKSKNQIEKQTLDITIKSLEESLEKNRDKSQKKVKEEIKEEAKEETAQSDSRQTASPSDSVVDTDEEGFLDELFDSSSEIGEKLGKYFDNSPFLQKVWNLLKGWAHGNKAFSIIATLPLFALATLVAFHRRKYKLNYNLTEHVFIQAYIACQILFLSIVILPINGHAQVNDLYELPWWFIFVLFWWDYKQLYSATWWKSFWRTILMFFYSLLIAILFAVVVALLTVALLYLLKPFIA